MSASGANRLPSDQIALARCAELGKVSNRMQREHLFLPLRRHSKVECDQRPRDTLDHVLGFVHRRTFSRTLEDSSRGFSSKSMAPVAE